MGNTTCIRIETMKPSSEIHNLRLKELDYVRKDLTPLNESWFDPRYEGRSISEIRNDIAKRYKATVGQKVQKNMVMFREAVVVIAENTTMEQLRNLAVAFEEKFGIKTMQIHIHRDEGYQNCKEWKRNLHAHMTFDWTKPNGKSIPSKETPYSKMQTITAEVLGMERGESSNVEHLNAIQYKNKKEGERFLALQQQNEALQTQVEQYQQSNDQLRMENEDLQQRANQIRQMVADLEKEVRGLKITKKGKQAFLFALNKITKLLGEPEVVKENKELKEKLDSAEKEFATWQEKVEKLKADLERRISERNAASQEVASLKRQLDYKYEEISDVKTELRKTKQEKIRLERIAETWKHSLPDVVKIERCDTIGTPRGHALRLHIEGSDSQLIHLRDEDYESYRKCDISLEQLIAKYATHDIDMAVTRKLKGMTAASRNSYLEQLTNTLFHALPSILYPALSMNVPCHSNGGTSGFNIRHKNREEILRELVDKGYQIRR